jgi:hypothetical protein
MDSLFIKSQMFTGSLEMKQLQQILNENYLKLLRPVISTYGLMVTENFHGVLTNEWKVTQNGFNGVTIQPGRGIANDNGNPCLFELSSAKSLSIPSTDSTYYIIAKNTKTNYEKGTVTLTQGSNQITGTDTAFTEIFAINRRIIVNGVAYTILDVLSDTLMEITAAYTGTTQTDVQYIAGAWFAGYPLTIPDNYIREHDALQLVVKNTPKTTGEYLLATITVYGNVITNVADQRATNLLTWYSEKPQVSSALMRERKKILYSPTSICSGLNGSSSAITAQILANDSHGTIYAEKLRLKFFKTSDDKTINVKFSSYYTDTGLPIAYADSLKWKVQAQAGDISGAESVLDITASSTYTLDISALVNNAYYELAFYLKKVITAFNLSILINEVYISSNNILVIE